MTINQIIQLSQSIALFIGLLSIAGSVLIFARAYRRRAPQAMLSQGKPPVPMTQEQMADVERQTKELIASLRAKADKQNADTAGRAGMPKASLMRPGNYVKPQ